MRTHSLGFAVVAVGLFATAAGAQTAWDGGTSALWGTSSNWSAATPTSTVEAQFYQVGAGNLGISIGTTNRTAAGLVFTADADSPVTISTTGSAKITIGSSGNASYITVDSGAAAAHTISAQIDFSGLGTTWTIDNASGFTASGIVDIGSGSRSFTKAGSGTATLSGSTVDLRGGVAVTGGTLLLTGTPGNSYFLPTSGNSNVLISSGKIDMRGGDGNINGTLTGAGEFTSGGGTTRTLTISRGTGYTLDTLLSGNLVLSKTAAAVTLLTNANTYSGGTTITAGRILANNATGSALGTGDAVINGGTLGGTNGTIGLSGDAVNVTFGTSGGRLEPGTSSAASKLTLFGGLDFTSAGTAEYKVKLDGLTPGTGGYDQTEQTGALAIGSGTADLLTSMNLVTDPADGTAFVIINRPGAQSAATGFFNTLPATGSTFSVTNAGTTNSVLLHINYAYNSGDGNFNDIALVVGAIPEPASLALMGLGGLMLLRRCRR